MSLRRRLILMAVVAVGVTVLAASAITWVVMRDQLRQEVDKGLVAQERAIQRQPPPGLSGAAGQLGPTVAAGGSVQIPDPPRGQGPRPDFVQAVTSGGVVYTRAGDDDRLAVTAEDLAVARGSVKRVLDDREFEGEHVRVLTFGGILNGRAFMVARSLEPVDRVMNTMLWVLLVLCAGATAVALLAARALAKGVLRPISELTQAAEHIEATGDLSRRVPEAGDDEVGRLAARFNAMLARLSESVSAQRQLVADVSHELRTPVTALRTNAEVLSESPEVAETERTAILDDIVAQTEELTDIVGDVIELARGDVADVGAPLEREAIRLDELVGESIKRAQRHNPGIDFKRRLAHVVVDADAPRLARAVNNLLDNAAKYANGSAVSVQLRKDGTLSVRDHGPGLDESELERVFERFYRGAGAREHAGSGLGLAIVKQVVEAHGGTVSLANAPRGKGAIATVTLPVGGDDVSE